MDFDVLRAELQKEAYQGKTDQEAADVLNGLTVEVLRTSITSAELWENTALTEYAALAQAQRDAYGVLIAMGTINVAAGTNSRATLAALFPQTSVTRTRLVALLAKRTMTSIAANLGLPFVGAHHVAVARSI